MLNSFIVPFWNGLDMVEICWSQMFSVKKISFVLTMYTGAQCTVEWWLSPGPALEIYAPRQTFACHPSSSVFYKPSAFNL